MKVFSSILGSGDQRRRGGGLRIALAMSLLAGILSVVGVALIAGSASAATATACTTTTAGTTSTTTTTTTFVDNQADSYVVTCYEEVGTGGTGPAYPTVSLTAGTGSLDASATFDSGPPSSTTCALGDGHSTTTTSGSGTTEKYIIECALADTPPVGTTTATPLTATATPSACTGCTGLTAGTLAINLTYDTPTTPTCLDPITTGATTTWYEGDADTYTVECYDNTNGGAAYYPTQLAVTAQNAGPSPTLSFGNTQGAFGTGGGTTCSTSSGGTTTTSGTGAAEDYILECNLKDTPNSSDTSPQTFNFQATGYQGVQSGNGTASTNSGLLTINVAAYTPACLDPASASAATFAEGAKASYNVECYAESGISGVTAYPTSISISGASTQLPVDANATIGTSATTCSTAAGGTTTTSGTGTTEEYILVCALSADTTAADTTQGVSAGPTYPYSFTTVGPGGNGSATSAALTITAATAKAEACLDPAGASTATVTTTFGSSAGGTNDTYTVECYGESGVSGVTAYPASISITTGTLPGTTSDANFAGVNGATTCNLGTGTTTTTSGSGTTEEYITECAITEDAVSADNGSYFAQFTPSTLPATASATLNINVSGPSDACLDPAGTASTTFREGIANTYTVECYGTGFGSASANNYPASISANNVTPAGTFLDGTAQFGGTAPPTACYTPTAGPRPPPARVSPSSTSSSATSPTRRLRAPGRAAHMRPASRPSPVAPAATSSPRAT